MVHALGGLTAGTSADVAIGRLRQDFPNLGTGPLKEIPHLVHRKLLMDKMVEVSRGALYNCTSPMYPLSVRFKSPLHPPMSMVLKFLVLLLKVVVASRAPLQYKFA